MEALYQLSVVFLALICHALASTFMAKVTEHPDFPGNCFYEDKSLPVPIGESVQLPGECTELSCSASKQDDGSFTDFIIQGASCGSVSVSPPCYLKSNASLGYPDCCPEVYCPTLSESESRKSYRLEDIEDEWAPALEEYNQIDIRDFYRWLFNH